ncbi:hypothetical protein PG984_006987 [Apiospora sp. TS-2023a]
MWPYLSTGEAGVPQEKGVGHTVVTKVTQDPDSRFPLTMVTQTRLWSPSFGAPPPDHDHTCDTSRKARRREEKEEEVVVAYIRIGFHMPCQNMPRYFEYSGRPIAVHSHDVRADLPHTLLPEQLDAEADDAAGALAILEGWSEAVPATEKRDGLVPAVKRTLKEMAREGLNTSGFAERPSLLFDKFRSIFDRDRGQTETWADAGVKPDFKAAVRPLDDQMVLRALTGAMGQIREACREYERAKGAAA